MFALLLSMTQPLYAASFPDTTVIDAESHPELAGELGEGFYTTKKLGVAPGTLGYLTAVGGFWMLSYSAVETGQALFLFDRLRTPEAVPDEYWDVTSREYGRTRARAYVSLAGGISATAGGLIWAILDRNAEHRRGWRSEREVKEAIGRIQADAPAPFIGPNASGVEVGVTGQF